jgi:hypothetical protein
VERYDGAIAAHDEHVLLGSSTYKGSDEPGEYLILLDRNIWSCSVQATLSTNADRLLAQGTIPPQVFINTGSISQGANGGDGFGQLVINTFDLSGKPADRSFDVSVFC